MRRTLVRWVVAAALAATLLTGCAGANTLQLTLPSFVQPCPAFTYMGVFWSPDGSKIAFLGDLSGQGQPVQVFTIAPDGSQLFKVAALPNGLGYARWSPDSRRMALLSYASPLYLYTVNADGTGLKPVARPGLFYDLFPGAVAWSPDGSRLAFAANTYPNPGPHNSEIFLENRDGTQAAQLTHDPELDSQPDWSPDGARIVYSHLNHGFGEIVVAAADGKVLARNGQAGIDYFGPRWSPDGQQLTFGAIRGGKVDLIVAGADLGGAQTVANDINLTLPVWLPDGRHIAFISHAPDHHLMVADAATHRVEALTSFPVYDAPYPPSWSPDGSRVAFLANDRNSRVAVVGEIYVMNRDGSGLIPLTDNPGKYLCLRWPF